MAIVNHIEYDAFGNVTSETDPTFKHIYAFTGRERDYESDLQYNRARYYDAALGRWLSEDPISFAAGDANLYRYVGNGPTNATDPSGLVEPTSPVPMPYYPGSDPNDPFGIKAEKLRDLIASAPWQVGDLYDRQSNRKLKIMYDPITDKNYVADKYGIRQRWNSKYQVLGKITGVTVTDTAIIDNKSNSGQVLFGGGTKDVNGIVFRDNIIGSLTARLFPLSPLQPGGGIAIAGIGGGHDLTGNIIVGVASNAIRLGSGKPATSATNTIANNYIGQFCSLSA